jgi:hypothetical protein
MKQRYLSAEALLRCRLLTSDGALAGLTDLILDTEDWHVRFLAAGVQRWATDHDVLVTPQLVARVDEARGVVTLDLSSTDLAAGPLLDTGRGPGGFDDAAIVMPAAWRARWRARVESGGGGVGAHPAAGLDLDPTRIGTGQLIRGDTLRGMRAETADGHRLRIQDLLIDDSDWTLAYLDLLATASGRPGRDSTPRPQHCLLARTGIDWLNRDAQTLHLSVWMQELRDAPAGPLPLAGGSDVTPVRVLTPKG